MTDPPEPAPEPKAKAPAPPPPEAELKPGSIIRVGRHECTVRSVGITGATAHCLALGEFTVAKNWPVRSIVRI